jgi:hypothetical protein
MYGSDFYKRIGAIGGRNSRGGGFSEGEAGRERARKWGKVGGTISRRGTGLTEQERARIRVEYEESQMQVSKLSRRFK